jgi:hypothetical protein
VAEAGEIAEHENLSDRGAAYVAYWTAFRAFCEARNTPFRMQKPRPDAYTHASIGRTNFTISPQLYPDRNAITVSLMVMGDPNGLAFRALQAQASVVEAGLGMKLEWDVKEGRAQNYVTQTKEFPNLLDKAGWPAQHAWLCDAMLAFHRTFKPVVRQLVFEG